MQTARRTPPSARAFDLVGAARRNDDARNDDARNDDARTERLGLVRYGSTNARGTVDHHDSLAVQFHEGSGRLGSLTVERTDAARVAHSAASAG